MEQPAAAVLFDDVQQHLHQAMELGMHGVIVDWHRGVTLEDVKAQIPGHGPKQTCFMWRNSGMTHSRSVATVLAVYRKQHNANISVYAKTV